VQTTKGRLREMEEASKSSTEICIDMKLRPLVIRGNALNYRKIISRVPLNLTGPSLICVHPPYLNALRYTKDDEDDLSRVRDPQEFIQRLGVLAKEIHGALAPSGMCAVLMGDVRKAGKLIPLGYETLNQFAKSGFELQDIVVKTQHHDRSSEFYVRNDKRLLLSHEYLLILRKSEDN
jgi:hypothetical protein